MMRLMATLAVALTVCSGVACDLGDAGTNPHISADIIMSADNSNGSSDPSSVQSCLQRKADGWRWEGGTCVPPDEDTLVVSEEVGATPTDTGLEPMFKEGDLCPRRDNCTLVLREDGWACGCHDSGCMFWGKTMDEVVKKCF